MSLYSFDDEIEELTKNDIAIVDADTIIINAKSKDKYVDEETGVTYVVENKQKKNSMPSLKREYKERKLPKAMEDELREKYRYSIVNDYGKDDDFHLSEEIKIKRNKFYTAFSRLRRLKRKYAKLDEYIRVYRIVYDCIRIVAESQNIYDTEKFINKVITGKIVVAGLVFPKYTGKDRKRINWEYIAEFIIDDTKDINILFEDPSIEEIENFLDTMTEEEQIKYLLGEELFNECEEYFNTDELYREDVYVDVIEEEEMLPMKKAHRSINNKVKEFSKKIKRLGTLERIAQVYGMDEDDMDEIEKLDRKRKTKADENYPVFTGSLLSDDDYNSYMYKVKEYEFDNGYTLFRGKNMKSKDYNHMIVMDIFEKGGINTRKFIKFKEDERRLKEDAKKYKKMEAKLKKKLLRIEKKSKERKELLSSNKNKKKKGKKNKKEDD